MHLSEGVLPLSHAAAWGAAAAPFLAVGWRRFSATTRNGTSEERALLGMAGAVTFAVTLFPIPVPVAGATSHMCATPLMALLLGPSRTVVLAAVTLLLQALFFAHGGLTTLGANIVTLGIVGPWTALACVTVLRAVRVPAVVAVGVACAMADVGVYLADAGILGAALAGPQPFGYWFARILLGFAPVQLPLAALEGIMSGLLMRALCRRRTDLVPAWVSASVSAPISRPLAAGLALVACSIWGGAAAAEPFRGIDDTVFAATAAAAGHASSGPLFSWVQGDVLLFTFSLGSFIAGLIVGTTWLRLTGRSAQPHAS